VLDINNLVMYCLKNKIENCLNEVSYFFIPMIHLNEAVQNKSGLSESLLQF